MADTDLAASERGSECRVRACSVVRCGETSLMRNLLVPFFRLHYARESVFVSGHIDSWGPTNEENPGHLAMMHERDVKLSVLSDLGACLSKLKKAPTDIQYRHVLISKRWQQLLPMFQMYFFDTSLGYFKIATKLQAFSQHTLQYSMASRTLFWHMDLQHRASTWSVFYLLSLAYSTCQSNTTDIEIH